MLDPVDELKTRAEILQHAVRDHVPAALERLRALTELKKAEPGAIRNGSPATGSGNSGVAKGPPSVS